MTDHGAKRNEETRKRQQAQSGRDSKGRRHNKPQEEVHGGHYVHDEGGMLDMAAGGFQDPHEETEKLEWKRPRNLPYVPNPPGWVLRYCRWRAGNELDDNRLRERLAEGWQPIPATAIRDKGYALPTTSVKGLQGDYIGAGDLVLCAMPEQMHQQRESHYVQKVRRTEVDMAQERARRPKGANHPAFSEIEDMTHTRVEQSGPRRPRRAPAD